MVGVGGGRQRQEQRQHARTTTKNKNNDEEQEGVGDTTLTTTARRPTQNTVFFLLLLLLLRKKEREREILPSQSREKREREREREREKSRTHTFEEFALMGRRTHCHHCSCADLIIIALLVLYRCSSPNHTKHGSHTWTAPSFRHRHRCFAVVVVTIVSGTITTDYYSPSVFWKWKDMSSTDCCTIHPCPHPHPHQCYPRNGYKILHY